MPPSTKESIVLNAWEMVTKFPSLKKLNFVSSFAGMLWLLIIVLYQLTFTYILIFQKTDSALEALKNFLHTSYFPETVGTLVVIFLMFVFLQPIATGGMIEMMHSYKKNHGERKRRSWQGFFDGLGHFLPIFELNNLTSLFRPLPIISSYILLLRMFGMEYFGPFTIGLTIYIILAIILGMFFIYSNFFVILEGKTALQAISASTGMSIRNISLTGRFYFTNIFLYFRTIFVGALFLLIPFIISAVIGFIPVPMMKSVFVIVSLILSFIFFLLIAHLNSTLEIFILAVWYETFLACKEADKEHTISEYDNDVDHHNDHGHH